MGAWWWLAVACTTSPTVSEPIADVGAADHATMAHRFDDVAHWAQVFDDPARDAWQKPAAVVAAMGIAPGQAVADLGAGTGYLVAHLVEAVGPSGRVLALDVEPSLVAHMAERFGGDPRVEVRETGTASAALQPREVDHVVLLDVYHHIGGRAAYFSALRRAMRPGGRLTVVDFDPDAEGTHGPPKEHRISLAKVTDELTAAGWVALPADDPLDEQYIGVFGVSRSDADLGWLVARSPQTDLQLIDVRTPAEFAAGHIPGARNAPLATLDPASLGVDRTSPVVLVCQSGQRSAKAADRLAAAGYQAVNLLGGTGAWAAAGHPLQR